MSSHRTEVATLGGGCFWCTEAVFEQLKGVEKLESGYSGGKVPNPSYQQVCTGATGHAEVVLVVFDPGQVTYEELLKVFFEKHDPTQGMRQGNDVGTQYRSLVLTHSAGQDRAAAAVRDAWREKRTLEGWQVDRAVRDHIASKGYGEKFLHRTGHSIGTRVHGDGANLDDFETHDTRELVEGLAFSIEPGIYLPDEGLGVRTEIDVFLADEGPKVFSKIQQELVRVA